MDNITFTHDKGQGDTLFHDFSLNIQPGEKIGLVGSSGSGKTTLTKLLLRFADIDSGKITIDSQDIAEVTQASLRQQIAYVPQEPLLFHRLKVEIFQLVKIIENWSNYVFHCVFISSYSPWFINFWFDGFTWEY